MFNIAEIKQEVKLETWGTKTTTKQDRKIVDKEPVYIIIY